MRVLLVHPAGEDGPDRLVRLPPLGLAYIAGTLREAGHEVRIIDAPVTPSWKRDLEDALSIWRPEAAGISVSTAHLGPALALAARIKAAAPRIPVILGGVHATLFPGEVLGDEAIDFAVHGNRAGRRDRCQYPKFSRFFSHRFPRHTFRQPRQPLFRLF